MKNRQEGFTLSELMIVVVILFIVAGVLFGFCSHLQDSKAKATDEARRFVSEMGLTVKGLSCAERDTDGDGYVSCTVSVDDGDGRTRLEAVECAASWSHNEGCRLQKPMLRSTP